MWRHRIPECHNWEGPLRRPAQTPPSTEEEPPQGVNLSWVTQGRAPPGARAPVSQPSASPLQEPPITSPTLSLSSPGAPLPALLSHHQDQSSSWRLILQLSSPRKGEAST